MKIQEAIEILTNYNLWRRDDNTPNSHKMPDPKEIGIAIDKAVESMKWIVSIGGGHNHDQARR